MTYVAVLVGASFGIFGGGWLCDKVADILTQRNNGIREPEMRLPTITLSMFAAPLSLVLYGVGIDKQWPWIVPVIGLGLRKLAIPPLVNEINFRLTLTSFPQLDLSSLKCQTLSLYTLWTHIGQLQVKLLSPSSLLKVRNFTFSYSNALNLITDSMLEQRLLDFYCRSIRILGSLGQDTRLRSQSWPALMLASSSYGFHYICSARRSATSLSTGQLWTRFDGTWIAR